MNRRYVTLPSQLYWLLPLVLIATLLTGCWCGNTYAVARGALDVVVDALPLPPGSEILERYDGISTGQVEACRSVKTELLVGNELPASEVYQFYKDQLIAQGWSVALEDTRGVVLKRDNRYGIEISDNYNVSNLSRDTIENAETQFESLVFIGIGYGVYDPKECQEAIEKLGQP